MLTVTVDLETSLSSPWTEVDRDGKPTFAPLPLHVPELACWLVAKNGADLQLHTYDRATDNEGEWLLRLSADLKASDRCVTFNGRGFDLPLLSLRALACTVDWSWWELRRRRIPAWKNPIWHYDLQDQLGDYGACRSLSLDRVARLLGLGKQGMHGNDVFEALTQGRRSEVGAYCANDVVVTYLIYLRWSFTHGGATGALEAYEQTLAWAAAHPILAQFYNPKLIALKSMLAAVTPLGWDAATSEWTGKTCSVCSRPQFTSPGGDTCENGHGGAPARAGAGAARMNKCDCPDELVDLNRTKCGACRCTLGLRGGMNGTGLCGPCCTGDSSTLDEKGETW